MAGLTLGARSSKSPRQAQLTTLHSFDLTDDGGQPAGLVQGADGNFYGTTYQGGADNGDGTVFKVTPTGALTTLHTFHGSDGLSPAAGLVQGTDGNFYGTTSGGGANGNYGTIFRITPGGMLTTLHSFNGFEGVSPDAGLVQATDGNFYGTTGGGGGANGGGTVFRITPGGTLSTLYSFCSQPNCADGSTPYAGLVQAADGNFYGTTANGGAHSLGTVFKITSNGTLAALYSFCSQPNCADGAQPGAGLVQATDGNFYGTTPFGGASNNCCGTIFKITPQGTLTTLHSFDQSDGANPDAGLIQATDGNFYGTTYGGGTNDNCCGTVFKLSVGIVLSPVQFVPVTPCRLVDTRQSQGGSTIQGGTFETFNLPQLAQQSQNCGNLDLSLATGYSLNPAVVPQGPLGYLTIWPAGRPQPPVATTNSLDGRVKANAAIVQGGASEAINVFASNTTDVVIDIDGYFAPPSQSTLVFNGLTPCRVVDTRDSTKPPGLGPPFMPGGVARDFPVLTSPCFLFLPTFPAAYSFNVTAVPHVPLGYLTIWPTGQPQPLVSTLNAVTGTVTANAAIVSSGTGGDIDVFPSNDIDLVIDVNGYFGAPGLGDGLSLYPVVPCRALDTRNGNGAFQGTVKVDVVDSACVPSSSAQAYVFNATVVPSGPLGYLTLWPDGTMQPLVATLNAVDGAVTSNMAIVPTTNGSIDAYASNLTQLIIDISSYFAP